MPAGHCILCSSRQTPSLPTIVRASTPNPSLSIRPIRQHVRGKCHAGRIVEAQQREACGYGTGREVGRRRPLRQIDPELYEEAYRAARALGGQVRASHMTQHERSSASVRAVRARWAQTPTEERVVVGTLPTIAPEAVSGVAYRRSGRSRSVGMTNSQRRRSSHRASRCPRRSRRS